MPSHLIFIDDSGTKEYAIPPTKYSILGGGVSTYFVFCGILVSESMSSVITNRVIELKLRYFKTKDVEIKSNWLRLPGHRKTKYLDPFDLTEAELTEFTEALYDLITSADLELLASIVNKPQMEEEGYPTLWYAPTIAYEVMMMRVVRAVPDGSSIGVLIDDTTGATPKGNQFKANLTAHHARLRKFGSSLKRSISFAPLATQTFVNSRHSHLVQLADLCAYNVHRQFQMYGNEWEDGSVSKLPTYAYYDRIEHKFRHNDGGVVQGYGIIKMPERKKLNWTLDKK